MKTSMQYLHEYITDLKSQYVGDHHANVRSVLVLIEHMADQYCDLNKKEIADAWSDGQGNIPHYSKWSPDDYADATDYIKHTYPTL